MRAWFWISAFGLVGCQSVSGTQDGITTVVANPADATLAVGQSIDVVVDVTFLPDDENDLIAGTATTTTTSRAEQISVAPSGEQQLTLDTTTGKGSWTVTITCQEAVDRGVVEVTARPEGVLGSDEILVACEAVGDEAVCECESHSDCPPEPPAPDDPCTGGPCYYCEDPTGKNAEVYTCTEFDPWTSQPADCSGTFATQAAFFRVKDDTQTKSGAAVYAVKRDSDLGEIYAQTTYDCLLGGTADPNQSDCGVITGMPEADLEDGCDPGENYVTLGGGTVSFGYRGDAAPLAPGELVTVFACDDVALTLQAAQGPFEDDWYDMEPMAGTNNVFRIPQ